MYILLYPDLPFIRRFGAWLHANTVHRRGVVDILITSISNIKSGGDMFGTDNHQQGVQPTVVPAQNNDDLMHNGTLEQPETVPQVADSPYADAGDPNAVFPPVQGNVPDPFGTTQQPATSQPDDQADDAPADPAAPTSHVDGDLLDIKQQALQHLSPLVKHLDQSPEEKFKTTMMLIQAADDKTLIPEAFSAAKGIEDDKVRAQALLDIINEINYFTQNNS